MSSQATSWRPAPIRDEHSSPFIHWLRDRASLTARLQSRGEFSVRLLRQGIAKPTRDEAIALGIQTRRTAWVREVALYCDDRPVVFAHTVLPCRPHGPVTDWLSRLGERSLGALLFSHPGFVRGDLLCRRLDRRHPLYRRAIAPLALDNQQPRELWARRSTFRFAQQSILVTEVFSPAIKSIPNAVGDLRENTTRLR